MFRIIALLSLIFLFSCQSSSQIDNSQFVEQPPVEQEEVYETIESEKQAEEINRKTEAEIQEVEVQDRIFFAFDSHDLSMEAKKVLDVQVEWLKSDAEIRVTVEGHCDERGTREYNIALGERRANSVKNYLIANGIAGNRIKVISYGKERPAFFGNGESIWSKNRRAVTIVGHD